MIIENEYLKEFTLDVGYEFSVQGNDYVSMKHVKCGTEYSNPQTGINLIMALEWMQKHKYECPAIPVASITASLGEQTVHVFLDKDGNTVVETRKGSTVEKSVTRKLIPLKEDKN